MGAIRNGAWKNGLSFFCLGLICAGLSSCSMFESQVKIPATRKVEIPPPPPPQTNLPYSTVNLDYPIYSVNNPKIYVNKSERRLWLIQDSILVRDYHIALGPSPRGDKYFRGDGRTPEGEYFVCVKNAGSQYYKSLGLNYPNPKKAEDALASGLISYNDYCSIVSANECKRMPPPNTALGGLIMIHGGGTGGDWTLGCIAVPNSAMDELFEVVSVGTPVYVKP